MTSSESGTDMTNDDQMDGEGGMPETTTVGDFDGWLAEQPEPVQALVAQHTAGLKSALESERSERKSTARQLRDALAQAEKGSALEKSLQELSGRAEQAERRAAFFEDAARPDVGCANARAAYLVATAEELFTRTGEPDWQRIKAAAPELFGRRMPTGNAGSGQGTQPATAPSMNDYIRRAAGRG